MTSHTPDTSQRRKKSMPLKRLLVRAVLPILLLLVGFAVMGVRMNHEIQNYTHELEGETLRDILLAQRNSTNLQNLSNSLQDLVYATDPQRARRSYVVAWGLLSESAFEQHQETTKLTSELIESLRRTWSLRSVYEEKRTSFNSEFNAFHSHLLAAAGLAAGLAEAEPDFLHDVIHQSIQHLESETQHREHLEKLNRSFGNLCQEARHPDNPASRDVFLSHCATLEPLPKVLSQKLTDLTKARDDFLSSAQEMHADAVRLRQAYSTIEISDLLGLIGQITVFHEKLFQTFFAAMVISLAVTISLTLMFYGILRPLGTLSEEMRRFLVTNRIPALPNGSKVQEINDVIEWLMNFCEMLRQKRASLNQLTSQYYELLSESLKDPLTGLANRRALEELISIPNDVPMHSALLMIDLDHFKRVNDHKGHLFGDKILQAFGTQVRQCVARTDVIYRYGGEEFCIFLSNVTRQSSFNVAERIRKQVRKVSLEDASIVVTDEASEPLSVSIGISSITEYHGEKDLLTLIREADLALYHAKHLGRNRTQFFEEIPSQDAPIMEAKEESHV